MAEHGGWTEAARARAEEKPQKAIENVWLSPTFPQSRTQRSVVGPVKTLALFMPARSEKEHVTY